MRRAVDIANVAFLIGAGIGAAYLLGTMPWTILLTAPTLSLLLSGSIARVRRGRTLDQLLDDWFRIPLIGPWFRVVHDINRVGIPGAVRLSKERKARPPDNGT